MTKHLGEPCKNCGHNISKKSSMIWNINGENRIAFYSTCEKCKEQTIRCDTNLGEIVIFRAGKPNSFINLPLKTLGL